jgi:hypothetical protein
MPIPRPISPTAGSFGPDSVMDNILCNPTSTPIKITLAKDTLQQFCTEHQGVNLAQGGNFSTYYDSAEDDGMRLFFFNVENQCAPTGVYLPLNACVNGFTAVARCPGGHEDSTKLGKAENDCLCFDFYAEAKGAVN